MRLTSPILPHPVARAGPARAGLLLSSARRAGQRRLRGRGPDGDRIPPGADRTLPEAPHMPRMPATRRPAPVAPTLGAVRFLNDLHPQLDLTYDDVFMVPNRSSV